MNPSMLSRTLGRRVVAKSSAWSCASNVARAANGLQSRTMASSAVAGLKDVLHVSEEVREAIATKKPLVALESTIYTHGAMGLELAEQHDRLVRSHGGIPAIIAIVDGVPKVGVAPEEIVRMIETPGTVKVSRRDVSYLVGMGLTGRKINGGTTIAGTMLLARLAGIQVFGTGGLGGVHRGGENTMDISADLTELGRTRVAVIASGCKGFLDIPRTLEYLETQGCLVSTFADGRTGKVDFPAFWTRESGTKSPTTVYTEKEAAAIIYSQERLNIESGMLFANPVPEEHSVPALEMQSAIEQALREADEKGFTGSANTPYVLGRLKELTGDKAFVANKALVTANLVRATNVAVELSRLQSPNSTVTSSYSPPVVSAKPPAEKEQAPENREAHVLVAGSVAVDLSCDYASSKPNDVVPHPHTSNPSRISQTIGGVGRNVALAAHSVSSKARVQFCSMVGDDVAGTTVLSSLQDSGFDTTYIRQLSPKDHQAGRTAHYVAFNDANKDLMVAMADMSIFDNNSFQDYWKSAVAATRPKWLVVDGNWSEDGIRTWVAAAREQGCNVAFEPVATAKSMRLFGPEKGRPKLRLFPEASISLASPNTYELAAMYSAAKDNGYLDRPEWFDIIDAFGMRGARERFVYLTSAALTDAGVPVQTVQLLPYIPTIITKLGPDGVLLTALLGPDDPRLRNRDEDDFILARTMDGHPTVGGIYMRMFPAAEKVENIVSVNGVGDTFLGVLVSGLAQGGRAENLIHVAQKGSVLTLKSSESVSPKLNSLEDELTQAVLRR